ncbi:MAG: MlaD family protein [Pyrinomonadaceae bacterium]
MIVFGFLILNATGDFNPFQKKFELKARFQTADGLREGSEVQLAGVPIGKVTEVNFLPFDSPDGEKVEALMSVDFYLDGKPINERIRTDSTAQLVATSVLGNDKMINITPGTTKGASVSRDGVLNSSMAISLNQLTATGNDLLGQINTLAKPANEILTKANDGEGTLGKVINDNALYNNLNSTLNEARASMEQVQSLLNRAQTGNGSAAKLLNDPALYNNLNKTVANLEEISANLRGGTGTAGKLLTDDALYDETKATMVDLRNTLKELQPTIKNINSISADLQTLARNLNEGKGTAGKLLTDDKLYTDANNLIERLNSTSTKFESLLSDVQGGKGTVGKLFTDETLYNNLNQTSSNINQLSSEGTKLMYDFRQNPKKYLSIQLKLF